MDEFPPEIMANIFTHIITKEDILSARCVCHQWESYVEEFVRELIPTVSIFVPDKTASLLKSDTVKGERDVFLHRGMGKFRRFHPTIFQVLPQLRSMIEFRQGILGEFKRYDIPLMIDNISEIPDIADQTCSESLDVYLVKYPDNMESHRYYDDIAREFFTACFEFIRRYRGNHTILSFSARCDVPYSTQCSVIQRITFRFLQGVIIISGIEVPNGEHAHLQHFQDSAFMMEQLKSIAPYVKGLSTWFLRFDTLWTSNIIPVPSMPTFPVSGTRVQTQGAGSEAPGLDLVPFMPTFPHLTTIRCYRQDFDMKVFSILVEFPSIDTLIHTYRENPSYKETRSLGWNIHNYNFDLTALSPCSKPVHLILPFFTPSLEIILKKFSNIKSIGFLNNEIRNGICSPSYTFSQGMILMIIDQLRSHDIQKIRIYTSVLILGLPSFPHLDIEIYVLSNDY